MTDPNSTVHHVSDTALWVAYFRARESQRPDALFRDPYAERLAGKKGFHIANSLPDGNKHEWAWVARTYLFDKFVLQEIGQGADLVVNLAAGLDARPYRLELPNRLRWIEVDFPEIIRYKEKVLAKDTPKCQLERVALDLSDLKTRHANFEEWSRQAAKIVILSEGFLIYFTADEVASLARDLAVHRNFVSWINDLASPGQLRLMQKSMGKQLSEAGAPFKFAPAEGPDFFLRHGWKPEEVQGLLKTAAQFNRPPVELLSLLPEPKGLPGSYPWTGVCLLRNNNR